FARGYGNGRAWDAENFCKEASLARPSKGGEVSDSLSASLTMPVMAFFFARGCTLTAKEIPLLCSLIIEIVLAQRG
ncbi:MAG TPA: hypothetical protein VM009_00025, partial [Terriglobales bacterium]|nr:hypothetical protein [Terriglobales bacterium]